MSITKIDVIEEVRESRDGNQVDDPSTKTANRDSNLTPGRERAGSIKSSSPFKLNPSKTVKIKKPTKKSLAIEHEVPSYIKKSPRWKKIESLNKDLDNVSLNFLQYTEYLGRVKREIEREQQRAELELLSESSISPSRRTTSKLITVS